MAQDSDQSEVFAFLGDAATYGISEPVKRIETHGAAVFLAGPDAYKVKRAVHYPYMDFSTLEKRKAACESELVINRETAPSLYLGVVPIARDGSGLHLGGRGEVVEWAVHLKRFDEEATLDRVVARGEELESQLIASLARAVEAMHRGAPIRDGTHATHALRDALDETLDELRRAPRFVSPPLIASLGGRMTSLFDALELLLISRGRKGHVRRCHGDLHLRNIVRIDGAPIIFDALEFDDALATTDTLYDLAFLLMDLCQHGLRAQANHLLNHYLWRCADEKGEIEGLKLLPLFLALRALIRAKVTITQMQGAPDHADLKPAIQSYVNSALGFLDVAPPCVIAIGGLSGTGKTTLALALAPFIGALPGAVHLRSDVERKRLFHVGATERLAADAYAPDVSARVYAKLNEYAGAALDAGRSVILDATFRDESERTAAEVMARSCGAAVTGIWLEAPAELLLERVRARQNDASDATPRILAAQLEAAPVAIGWTRLDASQPINHLKEAVLRLKELGVAGL